MAIPWFLCGFLLCISVLLVLKLYLIKKDLNNLSIEFRNNLESDTNNLLTVSTCDRNVRKLVAEINLGIERLRYHRHRYMNGDRELKEAITNISHDLRTPLTGICGYLELLKDENDLTAIKSYISLIQNRVSCLKQLSEELFCYSVVTSSWVTTQENVILNKALEENLLAFYGTFKKRKIEPVIEIPDTFIPCYIDLPAFNRIVSNILSNVLKYSEGDLYVKLYANGLITFTNSARSLTPVMVERLFDRFYTVETGQKNSTGLGLSIAKTLVDQMGGEIQATYQDKKLTIALKLNIV